MAELHPRLRGIEDPATLDANVADLNDRVRTIEEWYPNYIQQVNEAAIAVAGDTAAQAEAAAIRADAAATSVQQIGEQVEARADEFLSTETGPISPLFYKKAYPPVPAQPISDSSGELITRLLDPAVTEIEIPNGNWRFDQPVFATVNRDFKIRGQGSGKTRIELNHLDNGIVLQSGVKVLADYRATAEISGLTVARTQGDGYTGTFRPRNIGLDEYIDPVIRDVDSSGHIGFGVGQFRSIRPRAENVRSHDAKGGTAGSGALARGGTDGIHFYHCDQPLAIDCQAWAVGDDCISFGSLRKDVANEMVTRGARAINCRARDTIHGAGIKLYGHHEGARIMGNVVERAAQGAVYLTDHDDVNSYSQRDMVIDGLTAIDCRGPQTANVGVIRIRLYPQTAHSAQFDTLTFRNIDAVGCRALLTTSGHADPANHWIANVFLEAIRFKDAAFLPEDVAGAFQAHAVDVSGLRGILSLVDVELLNVIGTGILARTGDYTKFDRMILRDLRMRGYGIEGGSAATNGISVAQAGLRYEIASCSITGQKRGIGVGPAAAVVLPDVSPASVINDLTPERDTNLTIGGSFKTNEVRRASAQPTTGTWEVGDYIQNTGTGSGIRGWRCSVAGTYGTLTGITASGTSGQRNITVSTTAGLLIGQVISVPTGFPGGRVTIAAINGNTVYTSAPNNADFTNQPVTTPAPSWVIDPDPLWVQATAADIASAASAINTANKFIGKTVWDTTNNRGMRTNGVNATSQWFALDGSVTVTPA